MPELEIAPTASIEPPLPVPGLTDAAAAPALPPGFDSEAIECLAKTIFIRLQAVNDSRTWAIAGIQQRS